MLSLPQMGSSSEPNGLKFGHTIYFEDVTVGGAHPKSTAGGHSSSSGSTAKRGKGNTVQGAQPPRCQVEGCKIDLSDAKAYYSRHKVCAFHSKYPKVIVAGIEQRFCQQCSRFHQLTEFDQEKRSCRRRLAGHNERRRKPQASPMLISPYARLSPAVFENRGRVGGFLMEFGADHKRTLRNELLEPASMEQVAGYQSWLGNKINSSGPRNPAGEECFAGVADTNCALSLLSNQTWGLRNTPPALGMNNLCFGGTSITQVAASSHGDAIPIHHHLSNGSGSFKGVGRDICFHDGVVPDIGRGQISLSNGELPGELVMPQSDQRQSEAYESSQLMHWSL